VTRPSIIIDLRCLQDAGYAERGIGQHVRNAMLRARAASGFAQAARMIGLVQEHLPDLPPDILAGLDEVRGNAYLPGLAAGSVFLNPSPMTHDQVFAGRLLLDPAVRKIAMVYDFIPYEQPEIYIPSGVPRLNYLTALAWLNQYDHYLPISEDTAGKIRAMLRNGGRPSTVTGVPIAAWLEGGRDSPQPPRHILTIAGHDPRKNPELLIRAHAGSAVLQGRKIPLVIGGNYPAGTLEDFRVLAKDAGGAPALVQLPGRVSNEKLRALYAQAWCVVTPSRAEGFSMPVIEAMAAGVPSIASDIPAHVALVNDARLRFGPDDARTLRTIIEAIIERPGRRAEIVAAQAHVWPDYKAATVAEKIWGAIEALAAPQPFAITRHAKPKIALLSPLPPAHSGVADYSAACAIALTAIADMALFTPSANPKPVGNIQPQPMSDLPFLQKQYDRVISVLGNSEHHYDIFDRMTRYGSACICHDSRLLHFYAYRRGYAHAASVAARELNRTITEQDVRRWIADEAGRQACFLGDIARAATPLIFHARPSAELARQRFGVAAQYLPFAIYRPWEVPDLTPQARDAAKRRLTLDPSKTHIASFGFLSPVKAYEEALDALQILRRTHPTTHLHWVGDPDIHADAFTAHAAKLGLATHASLTPKFLPESTYRDFLIAADFGLQLRNAGLGSISGALQDCIAAGLPTAANQDLTDMLNAPTSYIKPVNNRLNPSQIAATLADLIDNPPATEPARTTYATAHSMTRYAESLLTMTGLEAGEYSRFD
jgi:glycosyltransferase involved in cell wall biosynthesis